ncbi:MULTISPECIES: YpdA family putative bacillithiol disulfide reductase [Sphingobacterium]|uniref:YpdA family putative bacillithiol disulfide reductase n=1 Tax=Sphingobacterium populi TaxID=1812824 RepID=A0ABW5UGV2_9SPHI|nr:YpdA family putative bacillithiol disulfide reductase [Sphingobacterium sp. CFCC 11742]
MDNKVYDVLIIGGGPIGLACGIAAKANHLSHLIVEKGCLVNSLYNYPINMTFFSSAEKLEIGGIPFVTTNPKPKRAEALEYYRRVEDKYDLNTHLFEEVQHVNKDPETTLFIVVTNRATYYARHVIVATGFYDIPMQMNIPGEDLPKVRHYYDDPHYYAKQNVVVIGASNSSIDAALETYRKGANVTLVIRRSEISSRVKYWVRPDIDNRLAAGEIQVYYESCLSEITPRTVKIKTATKEVELENDFVLALTGYRPNFSFLEHVGVHVPTTDARIPLHNETTMETNVAGLYLAGVVCGGLNTHLWFIENSRVHANLIMQDILKKSANS